MTLRHSFPSFLYGQSHDPSLGITTSPIRAGSDVSSAPLDHAHPLAYIPGCYEIHRLGVQSIFSQAGFGELDGVGATCGHRSVYQFIMALGRCVEPDVSHIGTTEYQEYTAAQAGQA